MGKRMGIVQLSDPSGQYEAVIFEEGLARYRDLLETGRSIIILAGADLRPEGVSVRIQSVESLEDEASRASHDLRVFLRDDKPLPTLAAMLQPGQRERSSGKVSLVVLRDDGEVEVALRERYQISIEVQRAIKAIPGVVEAELV